MFSSESLRPSPSLFESLPNLSKKNKAEEKTSALFLARWKGLCPGTIVPIASPIYRLVAASAKTIPRIVFFRKPKAFSFLVRVPSEFEQKKQSRGKILCSVFGALEGTRTPDLLVRSQSLYPTELPAHIRLGTRYILTQADVKINSKFKIFYFANLQGFLAEFCFKVRSNICGQNCGTEWPRRYGQLLFFPIYQGRQPFWQF